MIKSSQKQNNIQQPTFILFLIFLHSSRDFLCAFSRCLYMLFIFVYVTKQMYSFMNVYLCMHAIIF